jgi:hypothetical protein
VWLQEVIMGVLKKSLQTWQRSADSTGKRARRGVEIQSVASETDVAVRDGIVEGDRATGDRRI